MKKKVFDVKTAKKIINDYAEKINLLSRENKVLKKQLEDSNTSLQINKEILYTHLTSKKNNTEEFISTLSDLKKENERLTSKISWLFNEKAELAKKLYKLEDSLNDKLKQETNIIEKEKTDIFIYENKIKEKDFIIEKLQKQIEDFKKQKINFQKNKIIDVGQPTIHEIYIGDPNKFNKEMNNELERTRGLIKRYIYLMQQERYNNRNLTSQIEAMKKQIDCVSHNNSFIANNSNKNNSDFEKNLLDDSISFSDENETKKKEMEVEILFEDKRNLKRSNTADIKLRNKRKNVPKLNFRKIMQKYKSPVNIKIQNVNSSVDKKTDNNISNNNENKDKIIENYKNTIDKYKQKIILLKKQNKFLMNKNNLLLKALKIYIDESKSYTQEKDASMNAEINDLSALSSNIMYGKGPVENINNISKINKHEKINIVNMNLFDSHNIENEKVINNINIDGLNHRENKFKSYNKENDKSTKGSS